MIPIRRLVAVVCTVAALAACTEDPPAPTALPSGVDATAVPVPAPTTPAAPSPSPFASPTAAPATPSPAASADEGAALAAARARAAARDDCDDGFSDDAHRVVTEVDGALLVHVVCFFGAYQPSGELRVWDGSDLVVVPVEQWQFGEVVDTPEVVGAVEPGPEGTSVVNDVKYRGLGDCGLHQRWTFDGESLRLDLAREQECSDDGEFVPPDQWPVVYER